MSTAARALVGNSGDSGQIRKGRRTEKLNAERAQRDLELVLATPHGKRVLWRVLEQCGVYGDSAVFGDQTATYYNEGRRSIGLFLLREIEGVNPQAQIEMIVMAKSDREIENAERADPEQPEDEDDGS